MSPSHQPPRVLQYTYGGSHVSGIDTYLLEMYRALDHSRVQFDLLYRYASPWDATTEHELREMGATVRSLSISEHGNVLISQLQEVVRLRKFFRREKYEVVEINMTSTFMCLAAALIARSSGTRVRVVHAHDSATSESNFKRALKRSATNALVRASTHHWACSEDAARYLFGDRPVDAQRWTLVKNGIDVARFGYDSTAREVLRDELGLTQNFVVGMVGRLTDQKNHRRALVIFATLLAQRPEARLVIVGDGPLRAQLEDEARSLGIDGHVLFLGRRSDISTMLNAFDVLLAPSVHEGFPVIAIEAQATGLPMVVSEAFPQETNIIGRTTFIPLAAAPELWARNLQNAAEGPRSGQQDVVTAAGYDRASSAHQLQDAYASFLGRM
ncbi:glycosyltransferase [Microbacterium shaanxiense]